MKNELLASSLVFGIVVLFFGASVTSAYNVEPSLSAQPINRGNTLYVGGSGPGNYTTIQEAINNATNGDTVFVYNNTYNENIDTKLKKISLIGEERDITIIQGQTTAPVVKIGSSDVTIAGFTVIGTPTEVVIQVVSLSDNVFIFNNVIKDGGYGISLLPTTSKVTISDNTIINHAFIGIQLQTSSYDVISGNRIENNGGQGIELSLSSNHNSIINNAKEAILVGGITSTENTIEGNNISNNQIGIRFTSAGSNTIRSNNIQGCTMEGVLLQSSSENAVEKNNFIQNKRQAAFKFSSRNSWDANYWSNWIGFKLTQPLFQKFPKVIGGLLRLNFDWHPAKLPYNISTLA